jgi:hypothetical protein
MLVIMQFKKYYIRLQLLMKLVKIIWSVSSVNIPNINVDFPIAVTYILCLLIIS